MLRHPLYSSIKNSFSSKSIFKKNSHSIRRVAPHTVEPEYSKERLSRHPNHFLRRMHSEDERVTKIVLNVNIWLRRNWLVEYGVDFAFCIMKWLLAAAVIFTRVCTMYIRVNKLELISLENWQRKVQRRKCTEKCEESVQPWQTCDAYSATNTGSLFFVNKKMQFNFFRLDVSFSCRCREQVSFQKRFRHSTFELNTTNLLQMT